MGGHRIAERAHDGIAGGEGRETEGGAGAGAEDGDRAGDTTPGAARSRPPRRDTYHDHPARVQDGSGGGRLRLAVHPPDSKTAAALVSYAEQFVGQVPYVWGGSTTSGWDCSGFVMYVFAQFGISLPHSSGAQMTVGSPVASLADAQPGDILANPNHAAIYVGNGMVMNAMSPAQGTGVAPVGTVMGASYAIRRII